jgi:acyl-CoA dehydrogenase
MMDPMLADAFEQLIAEQCDLARVRRIEAGESPGEVWDLIADSGFLDALVAEAHGGAGLSSRDIADLIVACGRHVLPVPVGQTMIARAVLADAGVTAPNGAITFAESSHAQTENSIAISAIPFGLTAQWVWITTKTGALLLPAESAQQARSGGFGSLDADLRWSALPSEAIRCNLPLGFDARLAGAAITAALMAGAMQKAGEMTIDYANQRVQFGKPIGKLQAIQQQLSVMCEQMYAARTAALIGLEGATHRIDAARAATAKSRASEAAVALAAISHGVHAAIGITAEYDLQMFTRRLYEWRRHYGAETYWNAVLGQLHLDQALAPLDFVRA